MNNLLARFLKAKTGKRKYSRKAKFKGEVQKCVSSKSSDIIGRFIQQSQTSRYQKNFGVVDVDDDACGDDFSDATNNDNDNTNDFDDRDIPDIDANQSLSSASENADNCDKSFAESDEPSGSSN